MHCYIYVIQTYCKTRFWNVRETQKDGEILSGCGTVCIRTDFVKVVRVGSFAIGSLRHSTQHTGLEVSTESVVRA